MTEIIRISPDGDKDKIEKTFEIAGDNARKSFLMGVFMDIISSDSSISQEDEGNKPKVEAWVKKQIEKFIGNKELANAIVYDDKLWKAESEEILREQIRSAIESYFTKEKMKKEKSRSHEDNQAV